MSKYTQPTNGKVSVLNDGDELLVLGSACGFGGGSGSRSFYNPTIGHQ